MLSAISTVKDAIQAPSREIKGKVSLYRGDTTTPSSIFSYEDALQSIEIDRVGGDNKFFGFGVCQKTNIKLRDKNKQLDIKKDDVLQISFGVRMATSAIYWCNVAFPDFYVDDIQRDENTNILTITAGDRLYNQALKYQIKDLTLVAPYTLRDFATICAEKLGLSVVFDDEDSAFDFDLNLKDGANFDGSETIREALDALAEATQTIYYIRGSALHFRTSRNYVITPVHKVEKSQYFNLSVKQDQYLTAICNTNALGDSVIAYDTSSSSQDKTQYVRDNPFWEMFMGDVLAQHVERAMYKMEQTHRIPFTCTWRGNFLLEIGDWIGFEKKEGGKFYYMPLTTSTITYDGGYREVVSWNYDEHPSESVNNPSSLGAALKQTYAQVDKVNKEITLVASETDNLSSQISSVKLTTDNIAMGVDDISTRVDDTNSSVEVLTSKVNMAMTAEDVRIQVQSELENGVSKVQTGKGFTFDDSGLTIEDINPTTHNKITTTVSNNGMIVYRDSEAVLTANDNGVKAKDLQAETYLIIGTNSRFEDYGNGRTGCFWVS